MLPEIRWFKKPKSRPTLYSEEDFAKNLDWLSNLKLRFSYGQAGNTNSVSPYASEGTISGSVYYPFGTSTSVGNLPANIANPMLTWKSV